MRETPLRAHGASRPRRRAAAHAAGRLRPLDRQAGRCAAALRGSEPSPAAAWARPPPLGEQVTLDAAHQQWVQDQTLVRPGRRRSSHYQDVSLRCDEVEVDLKTMHLHAEGNVILDQGQTRMACDRMELRPARRRSARSTTSRRSSRRRTTSAARSCEKLDETHYRFHRGVFTSCDLTDTEPPPWSIEVRDAVVELEGYGHFRDAALKVRGVPFFYTPRLLWPIKRDRAAGFLVPSFGYSNRAAPTSATPSSGRSRARSTPPSSSTCGRRATSASARSSRWAPAENAFGEIARHVRAGTPRARRWEWKATGKHNQLFPGGYALHAELQEVSDLDFFQRFEGTIEPERACAPCTPT